MTLPLDRTRPRLTQPARRVASRALRLVTAAAWRTLHPSVREPFVEAPRPEPLPRLHVETHDGWSFPLFRVDPCPGGAGEPVILLHSLAGSPHAFRYGADSLAATLSAEGYAVYLACYRGDADAIRSVGAPAPSLDAVARIDLPAALQRVRAHAGAERVHLLGFGLGALLAMDLGARRPDHTATVTALAPPLRVPRVRSELRAAQLAMQLIPSSWRVPVRAMGRASLPLIEGERCRGDRLRGSLAYATDDVPVAMVQQLLEWVHEARPSLVRGVDLAACLAQGTAPLHVLVGTQDPVALPGSAAAAAASWGGRCTQHHVADHGHLDLLVGRRAPELVFDPVLGWLSEHRERSWGTFESVA